MSDTNKKSAMEGFVDMVVGAASKNAKTESLVQENKEIQARITNTKLKSLEKEIGKIAKIQEDLESEDISKRLFNKDRMLRDVEDRKNSLIFLNKNISKHFVAAPGSLIVIPSMTNNGKSTLTAHIAEAMISEEKRVLILSNEEKEEDVRARISCIRKTISFGDYKTAKCTTDQINEILDDAEYLAQNAKLVVISPKDEVDAYKVTTVKGIMATLEKARNKFDAVIIDYYTNVNMSEIGSRDPWHVNNELASALNIFKDTSPFPIIAMAQCEGIRSDKKVEDKGSLDFDSNHPMYRWKGGKSILTYATDIIELTKDFENSRSYLYAHKIRFGHGELQRLHCLLFDKKMQKFVEWSPQLDAQLTASKVVRDTKEKSKEVELSKVFVK